MALFRWSFTFASCITLLVTSCVEPYQPSVIEDNSGYLVVDAFINLDGTASVKLSHSVPISFSLPPPAETKASVTIEDEQGSAYLLKEQENGFYTATIPDLSVKKKYRLLVKTSDRKEYASQYIELKNTPPIDNIVFDADEENSTLDIYVNTHDASAASRYYRWNCVETWEYQSYYESGLKLVKRQVLIRPDEESFHTCWKTEPITKILLGTTTKLQQDIIQNFKLTTIPASSIKLTRKYSILVQQQSLTEEGYNYWLNLQKTTESLGGLFDPLPSEVVGNISCVTDPDEKVIGFFSGGSITEKRIFIRYSDLPLRFVKYQPPYCRLDTLFVEQLTQQEGEPYLVMPFYKGPSLIGYGHTTPICADCRKMGGATKRPEFWN